MKPATIAALAFIGWFLVLPSSQPTDRRIYSIDLKTPYKSERECRTAIEDDRKAVEKFNPELSEWLAQARCVWQDDRLAPEDQPPHRTP